MNRLSIPEHIREEIRTYPPDVKRRIRRALDELRLDPSGKDLGDSLAGYASFRVGRFRIIYRLTESAVEIAAVGSRETLYQEAARRLLRKG